MHKTLPALRSFDIIARRKRLAGFIGFLPPVRARAGLVIVGVSTSLICGKTQNAGNAEAYFITIECSGMENLFTVMIPEENFTISFGDDEQEEK